MTGSQLLIIVSSVFIFLVVLLLLTKGYRSWIYRLFSGIFTAFLFFIALFAMDTSYYSEPVEIKTTNYSKRKGYLYFLEGKDCSARVSYGYSINANEESWLEVGEKAGSLETVILLAQNDSIYQLPTPDYTSGKLDIWEKELRIAEDCFWDQINDFRKEQAFYSLAIGLLLFGLLLLFGYRKKLKGGSRGVTAT